MTGPTAASGPTGPVAAVGVLVTPAPAPVQPTAPVVVSPVAAPVSEAAQRAAQGVELTKLLLAILAGSIFLLVMYLWNLDSSAADKVDRVYDKLFTAVQPPTSSADANLVSGVLAVFQNLKQAPNSVLPAEAASRMADSINLIADRFPPPVTDRANLDRCAKLVAVAQAGANSDARPAIFATGAIGGGKPAVAGAPASNAQPPPTDGTAVSPPPGAGNLNVPGAASPAGNNAQSPPAEATPAPQASGAGTAQSAPPVARPGASTTAVPPATAPDKARAAALDDCIKLLEGLRFAVGGPIDIDRLRVMRDVAKDVRDHHQALRTFWISATQLVLVNVLLPLLTALLAIFSDANRRSRLEPFYRGIPVSS